MTRRWRSLLMLWLALCLPLQGFAAASGLWCAQRGFHAPAWAATASALLHTAAHPMPGQPPAPLEPPCHAASEGLTGPAASKAASPSVSLAASPEPPAVQADETAASTPHSFAQSSGVADGAAAPGTCAQCAACHASALLPAIAAAPGAAAVAAVPAPWAATPHPDPWPQGLERPPRPLLR